MSAARGVVVELDDHVSRAVDRATLHEDGADLVLVMPRQHLREVVGIDPSVWPRTFTHEEPAGRRPPGAMTSTRSAPSRDAITLPCSRRCRPPWT